MSGSSKLDHVPKYKAPSGSGGGAHGPYDVRNRKRSKLGSLIAKYRVARGLTQKEIAFLLRIQPATVSNYEDGRITPSFARMVLLCKVIGLPIEKAAKAQLADSDDEPDEAEQQ